MPTLPERATSILAVLARHQSPHARLPNARGTGSDGPSPFDWLAIVEAQRPGSKSESQQRQAMRFQRVRADLTQWVEERGLSGEHVEESAFYATVCTAPGTPDGRVLSLALIVFWIYLLDDFLDRRDAATLARAAHGAAVPADLVRDVRTALAPLQMHHRGNGGIGGAGESAGEALRVAHALRDVLEVLEAEWARRPDGRRSGPHGEQRFRRQLVTRQLELCAAAMLREVAWNVAFARDSSGRGLPAYAAYLRNGTVSIGMPAVAATAASFEPHPRVAWQRAYLAVAAGGAVVRLTNDLHTYFADVAEGKVTSVTLRLHALGFAPAGHDPDTSPEVRVAQTFLSRDLATAVGAFASGQTRLPDGPLALCVRHAVAFALAVYGDGSRHRRDGQAA